MIKKIGEIISGIKNSVVTSTEIEALAAKRKAICDTCINKSSRMGEDSCSLCGCILHWKQRSPSSSCPENHWQGVGNYVLVEKNVAVFVLSNEEQFKKDVSEGYLCNGVELWLKEFEIVIDGDKFFSKETDTHQFFDRILTEKKMKFFRK